MKDEELEAIISEIVERIKDVIYMNGRRQVEVKLKQLQGAILCVDDKLSFNYTLDILVNDLAQIAGRIRRPMVLEILKKQFNEKFTIMGGGQILDEISTPSDLWQWIIDNFEPKDT